VISEQISLQLYAAWSVHKFTTHFCWSKVLGIDIDAVRAYGKYSYIQYKNMRNRPIGWRLAYCARMGHSRSAIIRAIMIAAWTNDMCLSNVYAISIFTFLTHLSFQSYRPICFISTDLVKLMPLMPLINTKRFFSSFPLYLYLAVFACSLQRFTAGSFPMDWFQIQLKQFALGHDCNRFQILGCTSIEVASASVPLVSK